MSKTLKWAVGDIDVYEQMMAMELPDDIKEINPSDLVHKEEREELRFGGRDE